MDLFIIGGGKKVYIFSSHDIHLALLPEPFDVFRKHSRGICIVPEINEKNKSVFVHLSSSLSIIDCGYFESMIDLNKKIF